MGSAYEDEIEDDKEMDDTEYEEDKDDDEEEADYVPPRAVTPEDVSGIAALPSIGQVEDVIEDIEANIELINRREYARIRGERLQNLEKAHRAPRCQHVKLNGYKCGSPAVSGHTYCHFHGEAVAPAGLEFPVIEDGRSFQVAVMRVCQQIVRGAIEPANAKLLLQALSMAADNIRNTSSLRS